MTRTLIQIELYLANFFVFSYYAYPRGCLFLKSFNETLLWFQAFKDFSLVFIYFYPQIFLWVYRGEKGRVEIASRDF